MGLVVRNKGVSGNSTTTNGTEGLKVLIVGSGLGGLAAAAALRQHGHDVQIFEASGFSKEVGAALNTSANANGILKRLGISCKDIGACVAEWMAEYNSEGVQVKKIDLIAFTRIYEHSWRLAHRIKLHEALKKLATTEDGPGQPAQLHVSKPVVDVDTASATVHFKDGTSIQGDVVIGADGVHSITRSKLPGGDIHPFSSGVSAFRFLVSREAVLSDPRTRKFAEEDGVFNGIFGPDRSIVTYPTNNNTQLNFVCMHPDAVSVSTQGWGNTASRSKLLEVYKGFHPDILALLSKADEESLKAWRLLDMAQLPTYHHERLCVIGDAAHPIMPYLGQGAAMALEDAIAIGVLLEKGLTREEVPERLELYNQIRKERAELIQEFTRQSGRSRTEKSSFDATRFQPYCFGFDEWDNSMQKLREWKWAKLAKTAHPMTSVFGPSADVQRSISGQEMTKTQPSFTTISIKINTSRTALDGLLPAGNSSFRFKSPGSRAQCTFRFNFLSGLPSLGGKGYNSLGLYIHGVEYKDGSNGTAKGAFLPILFESVANAIAVGTEDAGIPTVQSSIDIARKGTSCHIRAGWEGTTWGRFDLDGLKSVQQSTDNSNGISPSDASTVEDGVLVHQYHSQVDAASTTDQSQSQRTIFIPLKTQAECKIDRVWRAESAQLKISAGDWNTLPTLYHIISRLEQIPVHNIVEAYLIEGSGTPALV